MCIQYYFYVQLNKDEERINKPNKDICIVCGEVDKVEEIRKGELYKDKHFVSTCTKCSSCGHTTTYTFCNSCKTVIIKNGHFWTYHRNHFDSIFDILCPACSATLTKNNKADFTAYNKS